MSVHKVTPEELIGDKPRVMIARPFHAKLKRSADKGSDPPEEKKD
jgi:hypothetical protein